MKSITPVIMISRMYTFLNPFILIIVLIRCSEAHVSIEQCPGTEVPAIRQQVQNHELSLIFYYTSWSADSLAALKLYNDVADYYSDIIYFSSIDCWHLSCNCSKTLNSALGSGLPYKWPTLVAHYGRRGQLQIIYHGLWSFSDIQQFVNNLLYPLERLYFKRDLRKIRKTSDAVIVGLFENADCVEYKQFLIASLKWLESDPLRTYRYAVVLNSSETNLLNLSGHFQTPNVMFVGPTNTRIFGNSSYHIWNASNILMWLHKELKKDLNYLHGYATPITVGQKAFHQPVLAIFVNDMNSFFSYLEPVVDKSVAYTTQSSKCTVVQKSTLTDEKLSTFYKETKDIKIYSDHNKCYYDISSLYQNLGSYYHINYKIKNLSTNIVYPFQELSNYQDFVYTKGVLEFYHLTKCLNSDITSSNFLQIGIVKYLQSFIENSMQILNTNRSLSVVLLEARLYKDYIENLDIAVNRQSMATTFIIDKEKESIFLMESVFDIINLKYFLHRFHSQNLSPYFKSEILNVQLETQTSSYASFDVKDINRHLFLNHLHFVNNKTLIVLIHSDECALCGPLQQSFIQLAAILKHISKELKFVRINAFHNHLPWQYNMPSLPALVVFPKHWYSETRLFPLHLKPNIRSVFAFILNQVSAEDKIKIVVAYCQSPSLSAKHSQSCWQFSKTLLMQLIGNHLHYWQLFETERNKILEHLRAFKDISLHIQRNLRL